MSAVTIRDVAKYAAVGVGTVSRVLNQSPNVSPPTRQRVLDAIDVLGYSPNPIARQLSLGKSMNIGAIVPTFTRSAFVERLRGAMATFSNTEYDLIVYSVESLAQRNKYIRESALRERVDAIIIISVRLEDSEALVFAQSAVPTILIDAFHPLLNCIYIDDFEGGRIATQHLLDNGHTKIGFVSIATNMGNDSMIDRYRGYREALANANITIDPRYRKDVDYARSAACQAAIELLTMEDRPTAIFAASDNHAFGVIEATQRLGLRVPEDVSIVGYDDVETAEMFGLTTIRQKLRLTGELGAKLTLETLEDRHAVPRQQKINVELVERRSVSPLTQ